MCKNYFYVFLFLFNCFVIVCCNCVIVFLIVIFLSCVVVLVKCLLLLSVFIVNWIFIELSECVDILIRLFLCFVIIYDVLIFFKFNSLFVVCIIVIGW